MISGFMLHSAAAECRSCSYDPDGFDRAINFTENVGALADVGW
jgi:hypothetical protein